MAHQIVTGTQAHDDGAMLIDGRPVHLLVMMGVVKSIVVRTTMAELVLEDHTGSVRCAFFTMDSAVLGLASSGCGCCTVRIFRPKITLG
jgi:hypothetical protein